MGCFLGCFGAPKDQKRRKRRDKVQTLQPQGTSVKDYAGFKVSSAPELLEKLDNSPTGPCSVSELPVKSNTQNSIPSLVSDLGEKPKSPSNEIRGKPEERLNPSPRKRVTFDTNVKTYEHVVLDGSINFSQGNVKNADCQANSVKPSQSQSSSENSSITSSSGSYLPNHRYQNCRGSDDEEDCEFDHEDSELDTDDGVLDEYDDDDDFCGYCEDINDRMCRYKSVYTEEVGDSSELLNGLDRKVTGMKPEVYNNTSTRDRSGYVLPVLNPVENLAQWKAVKSKGRTLEVKPQKENLQKDQDTRASFSLEPRSQDLSFTLNPKSTQAAKNQEMAVDASLSTWLSSSETPRASTSSSVGLDASTPKKSVSCGSISLRSLDDRPILGALTAEDIKQFSASNSPRKSPRRSPDDTPIIGTVGSYWSTASKDSSSVSSFKGIPNTTSKYREDKRVNWHSTPFEMRLERALNRGSNAAGGQNVR